ncbi:MAG: type II toxin-antitoxin system Phd/YefM family antitoxin [Candidatus Competibacteraceae bacterium]|nr:type II toxin-antitoxin system Phd/YefM family antitoxin [Candidatus Competibacteraceae bacterium]
METLSASDAKREFGEVLLKVQKEPVGINRNGKPVAVMVSAVEFEELQALKQSVLKKELQKGMSSLENGQVIDGDQVLKRLRTRIEDA